MFSQIRTSKKNKEIVSSLTKKLYLGTENVISRIALSYSLSLGKKLDLKNIQNSSGKEYSTRVLFGDYIEVYTGIVALHYNLHISDKDLQKYIKMHIDDGLEILNKEVNSKSKIDGFEFIIEKIESSIKEIL